jgi:DNA-binding PadR family transcriptional regulator
MNQTQQLIENVVKINANRPKFGLPVFLDKAVLELGVLSLLEQRSFSGSQIIRELVPLSRQTAGFGVQFPLLHEMEAQGYLVACSKESSPRRYYAITEQGRERMIQLRSESIVSLPEKSQARNTFPTL